MVRLRGRFRACWRRSCAGWPAPASAPPARPPAATPTRARAHARARARRRRRGAAASLGSLLSGGLPRLPVLDQRQRDVLGLALVAARRVHGLRPLRRAGHRRARRPRPGGRARLDARARARARPGGARGRRRRAAAAPGAARAAAAAHRRAVRVRGGHARARRRHARAELRAGARRAGVEPRLTCRATAASPARRSTSSRTGWSRTSAWTSSSCSCCSPA